MKKFLKISILVALLISSATANAQLIPVVQNPSLSPQDFFSADKNSWKGACIGKAGSYVGAVCSFPNSNKDTSDANNYLNTLMSLTLENPFYSNWVVNAELSGKSASNLGLSFLQELPGKHTASFAGTLENFQKEDEYTIEFDITGISSGGEKSNSDKPFLQIELGQFKAHEKDTSSIIANKITTIPKKSNSQPKYDENFWNTYFTTTPAGADRNILIQNFTNQYLNGDTSGKGYKLDHDIVNPNNTTRVKITTHGKNICNNCTNGEKLQTTLRFSSILMNNWGNRRFVGSDFVIHNLSITKNKDTTPPKEPTVGNWNKDITKDGDEISIEITNIEKDATVHIDGFVCTPNPIDNTEKTICKGKIWENGLIDGGKKTIIITDPSGNKTETKTPNLTIDNEAPKIILSEIIFDNGNDTTAQPTEDDNEANVKIFLGNGVNFDNFLAKITDNLDAEKNFDNIADIISTENFTTNLATIDKTGIFTISFKATDKVGNIFTKKLYLEIEENNKTELDKEIAKQSVKTEILYTHATEDKKKSYDDALTNAEKIKNNIDATAKEIQDAIDLLIKAHTELNGTVNKTSLKNEIDQKKIKETDAYILDTNEDKQNYDTILEEAKKVLENDKVTQQEVDAITKNLAAARAKLDGKKAEEPKSITTTNNSGNSGNSGGSGAGGYVTTDIVLYSAPETTPTKPITTADNQNIFKTGNIGGQCVSIVKNLDEPRLVDYYTSTLDINSGRKVHADVSRGEFMKMLFLASGLDISSIAIRTDITDVDTNNPYARYISVGLHYGLVHGQTDGTNLYFRPSDSLSRAEAAKIFIRAANLGTSAFSGIFSDVSASLTLSEYIESAYNNCLLHGRKTLGGQPMNGKPRVFEPYSPITIAETAKVLYNMTH